MSNLRFSDYFYKFLGFSEQESKLILERNNEYGNPKIFTSDSKILKSQRYDGLTSSDRALAEHANNEFGHLTDPVEVCRLKYERINKARRNK